MTYIFKGHVEIVQIYMVKFKGTVMEIEKPLTNDHLSVSKIFWKFHIPTSYNFAAIYREICHF